MKIATRPNKKICVFTETGPKSIRLVGREFFLGEIFLILNLAMVSTKTKQNFP
jgi:hypothetical protein